MFPEISIVSFPQNVPSPLYDICICEEDIAVFVAVILGTE